MCCNIFCVLCVLCERNNSIMSMCYLQMLSLWIGLRREYGHVAFQRPMPGSRQRDVSRFISITGGANALPKGVSRRNPFPRVFPLINGIVLLPVICGNVHHFPKVM